MKIFKFKGVTFYYNDKRLRHRLKGPAIDYTNGHKEWYKEGKLDRDDGPAIECTNGDKYWYKKDKLHRLDGAASDGLYYINGYNLKYKTFNNWINRFRFFI